MDNEVSYFPSGTKFPVGIGLKNQHFSDVLQSQPDLDFFEVHAENFMSEGGAHHRYLTEITKGYPLSIHGVGMSLGSAEGLDRQHLNRFKKLVDRYDPILVSEHLSWSVQGGFYLNDLLPLPLNQESLSVVADNIQHMQDVLGRKILIENPSAYMALEATEMDEPEFLAQLVQQTGCGLLLDINNVYVSGNNMEWDIDGYFTNFPFEAVGEIHLAGHAVKDVDGIEFRVDDHGSAVCDDVWSLFQKILEETGDKPTLIEWDNNIPALNMLLTEAVKAKTIMKDRHDCASEVRYG